MPFESSVPLFMACLLGAAGVFLAWLRLQSRWLLALATVIAVAGLGVFVTDSLVVTDREYLLAMFPRLANAAERQDVAAIMAALDPDLHSLREEVGRVLKQVRPTEVVITGIDVVVQPTRKPPEAVANLIVRVTGNVIDKSTPSKTLVALRVLLHKKGREWLVQNAEGEPVKPGQHEHGRPDRLL